MAQLNPNQQKAVTHTGGPTLVLAGAGAGKTRVLTHRVAHLIKSGKVITSRVLVVTFTNKAAKEMKERLQQLIGKEQTKDIWAGTFHSICCRILRRDIDKLGMGYNSKFIIYDPRDQEKTMDTVIRTMNMDPRKFKASKMLYLVSKLKNLGFMPDSPGLDQVDNNEAKIYQRYQQALQKNNALDFDDLLLLSLHLFKKQPEILERYQSRFEQILVDEYQDTNAVQFNFIKQLGGRHRNIFVVGDVDQSIYGFRHADFRIILRFQEDYPDATLIKLEENYRSTKRIIEASNALINHNKNRFDKTLISTRGSGAPIVFQEMQGEIDEASFVVDQIRRIEAGESYHFGDFAILYRTNQQSRLFEQKLIQYNIPYHVVGGYRFYDRKEIKDLLSYLNVINNPQDSLSLKRILNIPKRGIGPKAIQIIETGAYYEGRGLTLWEALQEEMVIEQLSLNVKEAVQSFTRFMQNIMNNPELNVSQIIEAVYKESGYQASLEEIEDEQDQESRVGNVNAIIQAAIEYEDSSKDPTNLSGFLERIALFSDSDQIKDGRSVTLMTVHSAKGLEYPVVLIPGVEEGIFPHIRSIMEGEESGAIEEERRLMYVALTRAKDRLILTYAKFRRNKRAQMSNKLSRFMLEVSDYIKIPGPLLVEARQYQIEQQRKKKAIPLLSLKDIKKSTPSLLSLHQKDPPEKTTPALKISDIQPITVEYKIGDKIRHPQWGEGQIQKIVKRLARIDFAEQGIKNLDVTKNILEKLS